LLRSLLLLRNPPPLRNPPLRNPPPN